MKELTLTVARVDGRGSVGVCVDGGVVGASAFEEGQVTPWYQTAARAS
jgi:hypothetical protein